MPKPIPSYEDWSRNHNYDDNCILTTKYTEEQRLKKYPFIKAAKILAVSFPGWERDIDINFGDTVPVKDTARLSILIARRSQNFPKETIYRAGLHINSGKLNHTSLIEIKELNQKQINRLTNIIYNTRARIPSNYPFPGYTCYTPRNALVFFDRHGKVFDYFEICFECLQYRSQSDRINMGSDCNQKFDLMKSFFEEIGIKFGTIQKD